MVFSLIKLQLTLTLLVFSLPAAAQRKQLLLPKIRARVARLLKRARLLSTGGGDASEQAGKGQK